CRVVKSLCVRPLSGASRISTLMTFAPQSANCRTQVGPARTRERSRTVRSLSADEAGSAAMATPRNGNDEIVFFSLQPLPAMLHHLKWRCGGEGSCAAAYSRQNFATGRTGGHG